MIDAFLSQLIWFMLNLVFLSFLFLNFGKVAYYLLKDLSLCLYTFEHLLLEELLTCSIHPSLSISL